MTFVIGSYYVFVSALGIFYFGTLAGALVAAVSIGLWEKYREVRRSV